MNESPRRTRFYRDKINGRWTGVCAGIADYTGLDVTLVRVAMVILTMMAFPLPLIGYLVAAWIAPKKPVELYPRTPEDAKFWQGVRSNPARTARSVRSRFRDLDRRLADVETYVTSSHGSLSREIDKLR